VPPKRTQAILTLVLFLPAVSCVATGDAGRSDVVVDCAKRIGTVRPLHGVNGGPLDDGGLLDLSAHHRRAGFPLTRLHDIHWPNPDVVDMHVVFPDPGADPRKRESYRFADTDDYLSATLATGTKVVYRLGESIEHRPRKRHAHPPRDAERWAEACAGIIRHYNEGWAGGFRHDIRYWEIWNEPDNRPACWTGNDEDYFRLYATTAKLIKQNWPQLQVGGPAVGNTGDLVDGKFRPAPFVAAFLGRCRRDELPLDFFSWHVYANDAREVARRAAAVRALLDEYGFRQTESHLNEWNYLPDNDWTPVTLQGQGVARRRFAERVGGTEGASFAAAALLRLQDTPLDAACYFNAGTHAFGLFDPHGVPKKTFHAFRAFRMLLETPERVAVMSADVAACAGMNEAGDALTVAVSNDSPQDRAVRIVLTNFPGTGALETQAWWLDADRDLDDPAAVLSAEPVIDLPMPGRSVCVVRCRRS
jgi:hypothetical protein